LRIVFETMFVLLVGAPPLFLVLGDIGEGVLLLAGAVAAIGLVGAGCVVGAWTVPVMLIGKAFVRRRFRGANSSSAL